MTFDLDKIDSYFPMDKYRPGQREAIAKTLQAFNDGKKFALLEAPTGSGKSAIGLAIAQYCNSAYYLSPQKHLQDQLIGDFGEHGKEIGVLEPMIDLKGRNAYPCNYYERKLKDPNAQLDPKTRQIYQDREYQKVGCDAGECKRDGKSKLNYCVPPEFDGMGKLVNAPVYCPYYNRLYQATNARICLMNFHSFLYQTAVVPRFQKRELLIIDEGHNSEDVLLGFIEIKISDRNLQDLNIKLPQLETAAEYLEYLQSIQFEDILKAKIEMAKKLMHWKEEEEWKHMLLRYGLLLKSNITNWISIYEEVKSKASRTVTIKPVFIDEFANTYLFSMADHILIMSATILSKNVMCDSLGMDKEQTASFKLPNLFPARIRPLHFRPSGSMSMKNKQDTLPRLAKDVEDICRHHQNEKGIIHTHSFDIADYIMNNCAPDVRSRFIFQNHMEFDGNKKAMIDKHKASKNSILLAPAMHEGLDLKDDLGRFQILCKVPYPSKGDPQIAARMEISPDYYDWRAATKLVQSYGRIYRHDSDYGVTYMLDKDFQYFINRAERLVPSWFREAIIW